MEFCPKCKTRLIVSQKAKENSFLNVLLCPKCNYEKKGPDTIFSKSSPSSSENIAIIGDEIKLQTMPTTRTECPKCKNREAFWWMVQTRGSDESPTQFFRCTKCNHTWRENT